MEDHMPRSIEGARGCTFQQLRSYIYRSNLSEHLKHFSPRRSIIEVIRHFRILMRGIQFWELDRIQSLFTGLCILLLTRDNKDVHGHKRGNLMVRFMNFADCVSPMSVHQMIEKLLENMEGMDSKPNMLKLSYKLSGLGYRGRIFAVCLLWSLLGRCLPAMEITMHRFRVPGELAEAIGKQPPTIPNAYLLDANGEYVEAAEMDALLLMLEAMELVLRLLFCCDNGDLLSAGYPEHFFAIDETDATFLTEWCIEVARQLPDNLCGVTERFGRPVHNIIATLMQSIPDAVAVAVADADVAELLANVEVALGLDENNEE